MIGKILDYDRDYIHLSAPPQGAHPMPQLSNGPVVSGSWQTLPRPRFIQTLPKSRPQQQLLSCVGIRPPRQIPVNQRYTSLRHRPLWRLTTYAWRGSVVSYPLIDLLLIGFERVGRFSSPARAVILNCGAEKADHILQFRRSIEK
jgi:hypothetical protein